MVLAPAFVLLLVIFIIVFFVKDKTRTKHRFGVSNDLTYKTELEPVNLCHSNSLSSINSQLGIISVLFKILTPFLQIMHLTFCQRFSNACCRV